MNQNSKEKQVNEPIQITDVEKEELSKIKKKNTLTNLLLIAILIVLSIGLIVQYRSKGTMDEENPTPQGNQSAVIDGELDLLGYEEIKAGLQSKVDESYMNLKINLNPVFNGVKGKGNLMIQNSKTNRSNIQVTIYLEETNEIIYVSPVLKPNQSITEDILTAPDKVKPGSYKAVAMFGILNPETSEKISETGIKLTLTIQ